MRYASGKTRSAKSIAQAILVDIGRRGGEKASFVSLFCGGLSV